MINLNSDQVAEIKRLAEITGRTEEEILKEAVGRGLPEMQNLEANKGLEQRAAIRALVRELRQDYYDPNGPTDIAKNHDKYLYRTDE